MGIVHLDSGRLTRRGFIRCCGTAASGVALNVAVGQGRAAEEDTEETFRVVPGWMKPGAPKTGIRGVDADATGRIYGAGNAENPVLRFSPDGAYLGSWGKGTLMGPHGLRINGEHAWVSDTKTHQVHQFTLDGKLMRTLGVKGKATDAKGHFNRPSDFAFGPDGSVYISDGYGNTRVVCYGPDGTLRRTWGTKGKGPGEFNLVHAIAIEGGARVYVADRNNLRVQIFDLEGNYETEWKHIGRPYGLEVAPDRTVYLCGLAPDDKRFRVLHLDRGGRILADLGETGTGPGQFGMAHSVHLDAKGAVYIADGKGNGIQKFARDK